jgi:hypothetical protein
MSADASARWLRVARPAGLALMVVFLAVFAAGVPARWRELSQVCAADACVLLALRPAELVILNGLGLSLGVYAGYQVSLEIAAAVLHLVPAALLFWRRSDSWMALLASLALVGLGTELLAEAASALARAHPVLSSLTVTLQSLSLLLFSALLFTFPNGRFVPRRAWVLVVPLLGLTLFNAVYQPTVSAENPLRAVILVMLMVMFIGGVLAQVYRYFFHSTSLEQQQTKWVLFGLAGMAANLVLWAMFVEGFPPPPGAGRLAAYVFAVALTAVLWATLPVSLAVAILRYRLWDIDLLIRRTLVYTVLTTTLALIYFTTVAGLEALVRSATGQTQSELAVVLSTLLIAALFVPVRRRWQQAIDRRFYRRHYNAAQVLAGFGTSLRDEVTLEPLVGRLVTTVAETMQPASISLWLRHPAD